MFKANIQYLSMYISAFRNRLSAAIFIAAMYFILWSIAVIIFPSLLASVIVKTGDTPLIFWDFMGLITLMLGIGLLIASSNPMRHWPVILIVSLFHIFMIAGFFYGYFTGFFNLHFIRFVVFNHLIWLIPNGWVLWSTYKRNFATDEMLIDAFNSSQFPLEMFDTTTGENVGELAAQKPVLLVFLRHFGCPFCKDSLIELAAHRASLEEQGISIIAVHMTDPHTANSYLAEYGLADLLQVSDPEEIFYKSFRLRRGSFAQLFGIKVWGRLISLAVKKKLFNTKPEGDVSQMPGIFLLNNGKVVKQFVHRTIADVPDYSQFVHYND